MAAFIPALISGVAGLAGGLLNRPKTTQQNSSSTTNTSQQINANQNSNVAPVYDPQQLAMRNFLLNAFYQRANSADVDKTVGSYVNSGVNNINSNAQTSEQAIRNVLASRGLSYSGAAATPLANAESSRIGQITDLRNQAPLIKDQLQGKYLTDFASFLSGLPVGQQGSGTSYQNTEGSQHTDQHGTITDPGNILGGAVSGLGSGLALMYGNGAFGGKK